MTQCAYYTDIGGCITPDVMDEVVAYLARRFAAVPPERLGYAKRIFWEKYAYTPPNVQPGDDKADEWETAAWATFADMAGIDVSPEALIAITSKYCRPLDLRYIDFLRQAQDEGIILGIISNTTHFIWRRQQEALNISDLIPPERVILSYEYGVSKKSAKLELFSAAVAAAGVPAENCAFTDDRQHNVERALQAGVGMAILHPKNVNWGASYVGRILSQAGWIRRTAWRQD